MMTDKIYQRLRAHDGRSATWALKHVFERHAEGIERLANAVERSTSLLASISESKNARRCAEIIGEIGTERFSLLRQWVPIAMPETLNALTLESLRENLENVLAWEKSNPPSPAS